MHQASTGGVRSMKELANQRVERTATRRFVIDSIGSNEH
jgi:hypothetical protein